MDAPGNPTGFTLTGGQASDLAGAGAPRPRIAAPTVIADKGDDADGRVLIPLATAGTAAVTPPKRNRTVQRADDAQLDAARPLIEHCFCTLKQCRAIATRYDKTNRTFLAAIYLAATAILLN